MRFAVAENRAIDDIYESRSCSNPKTFIYCFPLIHDLHYREDMLGSR